MVNIYKAVLMVKFFSVEDIIVKIGTLEAGAEFSYEFKILAEKLGKFVLVAGLSSNKTEMVTGDKEVGITCKVTANV